MDISQTEKWLKISSGSSETWKNFSSIVKTLKHVYTKYLKASYKLFSCMHENSKRKIDWVFIQFSASFG